ncbi:MAG: PEP/pyruvate-binding domain-containing protein [Crocinitomicaceae bacterium]|nr:PEP/pyruvate-binding domain-containing protein [Crocinitomicaceae bacterium]
MKSLSIGLILIWSLVACSQVPTANAQIQSFDDFKSRSSQPLYQKYGQVSAVKVVFDNNTNKIHFLFASEYTYHHEFCEEELGYFKSLNDFNEENYSADESRPFLLGNINYYRSIDKFALELGPTDRMNVKHLEKLFMAIKNDVYFQDKFYLMMSTGHLLSLKSSLSKDIPLLTPEDVYANQTYQPLSKKSNYGRVVIIRNWEEQAKDIRSTDILLLEDIPPSFPLVAGVVVTQFQTPLSHVSLLGQNRKIPVCAYTKLFQSEELLAYAGKIVKYTVEQDTFRLELADVTLNGIQRSKNPIRLKLDYNLDTLIAVDYLRERNSKSVGNKAANFGLLLDYSEKIDFQTPESAFAIPFAYYKKHSASAGIDPLLAQLLEKDNLDREQALIERDLQLIRDKIMSTAVDPILLADIEKMILRLGDHRRLRFRSSTNAEDRDGFSGAGLYKSKTGELYNESKPIDLAIKKVWASLWSYGAFMEREAFNIDHRTVAMGILAHRSFPNEEVNGVAITTNLYRDNYLGFVVNAQLGNENVVDPTNGITCDQFICYPDEKVSGYGRNGGSIDIITYSSLNEGQLVMTDKEIKNLANVLERVKRQYLRKHYTDKSYLNFGLDLEFKLDAETRQLYIKQMRIFNN